MAKYSLQQEQRRLAILQLLHKEPGYRLNDQLIQALLAELGQASPLSLVRTELAWLEQLGQLTTQDLPGCTVAILLEAGVDTAQGLAQVPGIARPRAD
jgi:hypothetical protein